MNNFFFICGLDLLSLSLSCDTSTPVGITHEKYSKSNHPSSMLMFRADSACYFDLDIVVMSLISDTFNSNGETNQVNYLKIHLSMTNEFGRHKV